MRLFVRITAIGCFALAVLAALVQLHPDGPTGVVERLAAAAVLVSALAAGIRWRWWPWPTFRQAVMFAVWLDLSVAVLALSMATAVARLCIVLFMGLNGVFVAFILGWRMQVGHLVICSAVIAAIIVPAAADPSVCPDGDLATLGLMLAPTITWVIVVSLCGSILVEYGRTAVRETVKSAHYDALTGLRNRRGMYAAIKRRLGATTAPIMVVAAVCDIDRFKQLNDRDGHAAGDAALAAKAQHLDALATGGELTARIGGDELVLVTFTSGAPEPVVAELSARLAPLTLTDGDHGLTASLGIAAHSTADPHFGVNDVLRRADAAMYEAKRSGGGACVIYQPGLTQSDRRNGGSGHFRSGERA